MAHFRARGSLPSRTRSTPLRAHQPPDRQEAIRVSVVVPAKNEEGNIAWVLRRLPLSVDEVILVDGHSTDRTVEIARAIRPDIVIVEEPGRGKGTAMRAGFAVARGRFVIVMDADGSMDPGEIERYIDALESGADLAKGSRYINGGTSADLTAIRSLGNRTLLLISNLLYGQRFTELCYGYLAIRQSRIEDLALSATGFEIETEIVCRSVVEGLRIAEIPSHEAPRMSGQSNLHAFRDGFRILGTMLRCAITSPTPSSPDAAPTQPTARAFEGLVGESTQLVRVMADVTPVD